MTNSRFSAWTRRRFVIVTATLTGRVLGSATFGAVAAKHHKHHHKRRCLKTLQSCTPNGKRTCCQGKLCEATPSTPFRCCKDFNQSCKSDKECCGGLCQGKICVAT
jgi:hypothetical protein